MSETEELSIRDRLKDLNTKAYYLLVALSFIYGKANDACSLKVALTLTAVVAVLPLQDIQDRLSKKCKCGLEIIRWFKVVTLFLAFVFTLYWVWFVAGTSK